MRSLSSLYPALFVMLLSLLFTLFGLSGCGYDAVFIPGPKGDTGAQGPKGDTGENGNNGSNGADAVSVYAVQLCPNNPPASYPNVFPEVALCIQHKLYGVYNGNIDYFSEIPPGNYSSIAPQGCNLHVYPDCVVTQN